MDSEGVWVWIDGVSVNNDFPWGEGEPNNLENEDCGEIYIDNNVFIGNDQGCNDRSVGICQKTV